MSAHAILSASGAHIWMNCPHAARAQMNFPDVPTVFSREGTFAHAYCEAMLQEQLGLLDTNDADARVARASMKELVQSPDGAEFINSDFYEHCKAYVRRCMIAVGQARAESSDALVLSEQRLDYSRWVPEGFGTGDLVIISKRVLRVRDLKYGKGVEIEAVDNEQLDMYALGAIDTYNMLYDFDKVIVEIDQPRRSHMDVAPERSVDELIKWGDEVVAPRAALAWEGTGKAIAGDWCRFCKARHTCRARMEAAIDVGPEDDPYQLSDDEVVAALPKLTHTIKWATDLKAWAAEKAVSGEKTWDGWKLVSGRSNRIITDNHCRK